MAKNLHLIVGLGQTGLSCIRYLAARGLPLMVTDSRLDPPGLAELQQYYPEIPIKLGAFASDFIAQADVIIASPGVDLRDSIFDQARDNKIPIWGDIELFAQQARAPIVGITGSNAKGTVTTLLAEMATSAGMNVRVGGNIGTPALDLLQNTEPDLYILELSSFQLETTYSLQLKAATILNISPDHLDRYADLTAYTAAKQRIFQHCQTAIYNREDNLTYPQTKTAMQISFGLNTPNQQEFGIQQHEQTSWLARGDEFWLPCNALKIKGRHNWANALAACALGQALDLPRDAMLQALQNFPGLTHRCQWVADIAGVSWYNDSKGTNVGATLAAIEGLGQQRNLILLAGGLGKDADFSVLRDAVIKHVKCVILFGRDASLLKQALSDTTTIIMTDQLANAVQLAQQQAQAGDCVLLSPACASQDQFKDYAQRGDYFMQYVRDLTL